MESTNVEIADELEAMYLADRVKILEQYGNNIPTPLASLHEMARQYNAKMHIEYHEVRAGAGRRFVAEVFVGQRRGIGEARTRKLAAHMGAVSMLRRIAEDKTHQLENYIPPYYLVPGCRINPTIFADLTVLCDMLKLDRPKFVTLPLDPELENGPLFMVKCQIGRLICIGESDSFHLAKRIAAKKIFEALTGDEVPLDFTTSGADCVTLKTYNVQPLCSQRRRSIVQEVKQAEAARREKAAAEKAKRNAAGSTMGSPEADEAYSDTLEETLPPRPRAGAKAGPSRFASAGNGFAGNAATEHCRNGESSLGPFGTGSGRTAAATTTHTSEEFGFEDELDEEGARTDNALDRTTQRMQNVVNSMTTDVKNRLAGLRI